MKTIFRNRAACAVCHRETDCAGLAGAHINNCRLITPENIDRLPEHRRKDPEYYICETCASEKGKKTGGTWALWAVSLLLTFGTLILIGKYARTRDYESGIVILAMIPMILMIVSAMKLVLKSRISGQFPLLMLAFTPLIAIPFLFLHRRINERIRVRTALAPFFSEEYQKRIKTTAQAASANSSSGAAAPATNPGQPASRPAARDTDGEFYIFVQEGQGFGSSSPDMLTEMIRNLKEDYPASAGMTEIIVRPYQWGASVSSEGISGGGFVTSLSIPDAENAMRRYLTDHGVSAEAADRGIAAGLRRVNPFGGLFVFGVPIRK